MQIKSIKYYNFRNIKDGIVPFSGDDIILEGINGQGKTNILESVYTVCYGNSFRTVNSRDMIKIPAREMSLYARLEEDDETYDVIFSLEQGKRRISVNGREIRDRKDLMYLFPCIVFTHEDIDFIKGALIDSGALGASMSGTGPTVFGIFDDVSLARGAYERLRAVYRDCFLTKNIKKFF